MPRLRGLALALLAALAPAVAARAQDAEARADRVRTESGVDPTRIVSRAALTVEAADFAGPRHSAGVITEVGVGRGRWAAALEWRWAAVTRRDGASVEGFGDLALSATCAAFQAGPHAIAVAAKVVVPVGAEAIGGNAVSVTPAATWVYSTDSRLVFAVRPQYAFTVAREAGAPRQSLLSLRGFVATFRPNGLFGAAELRILQDLELDRTDVVISPAIGWNLGHGVNVATRGELPVTAGGRERYASVVRAGASVVF